MDEKTFDRVEKKFLITKEQKDALMTVINEKMKHDGYFHSGVYNIYFDTDNYDFIIQSIDHPVFKEKLRIRSYEGYDKVFFEIKTITNIVIIKNKVKPPAPKQNIIV